MTERAIFVTGGASGIGRAAVERFHAEGWFVGAYDVDADGLAALAETLGERVITGLLDVRDRDAYEEALAGFAAASGGRLDVLFNNAGIAVGGYFDEVPFERIRDMVDINLMGVLNGIHAAVPYLRETPNSLCLTTCSSAATFGTAAMATYAATKFAAKGFTEAMSVELARFGSRAADISPGIIDTPLWQSERFVKGKQGKNMANMPKANQGRTDASRTLAPEVVAECALEAYAGDRVHYYVPPELVDRYRAGAADPEALRDAAIEQHTRRK